ncbi:hypothetical protein F5B17DRAFT_419891 [Nemania serpens]|nr:hypothetical protein F5B17DRAFT_419891 [Nemania serpens]
MSYRIEVSPNNRAGCQDKVCKDAKTKITKGELRFGVWIVMPGTEHGSWRWRHWGCVSGKTISNVQESIKKGDDYDWEMLDGYDEISDADIKAKIQRVVTQGHIDAEDFNGDPEFNVPGKTAIRGRAKKPKADEEEDDEGITAPEETAPKEVETSKRCRKGPLANKEEEEAEEAGPVKKKARVSRKAKKDDDDDDEQETVVVEPVKKKAGPGRKAKKVEEPEEEEIKPVKKARASRKVKKEDEGDEENEEVAQPAKKAKGGRKAKQVKEENEDVEEPEEPAPAPAKKGRGKRVKKEASPSPPPAEEPEEREDDEEEDDEPIVKTAAKGRASRQSKAGSKGVKRRTSRVKAEGDE